MRLTSGELSFSTATEDRALANAPSFCCIELIFSREYLYVSKCSGGLLCVKDSEVSVQMWLSCLCMCQTDHHQQYSNVYT